MVVYRWLGIKDTAGNPAFLTPWSIVHMMSGFLFYGWATFFFPSSPLINFIVWSIVHTLYEFKDWYISYVVGKRNNSLWNSVGDELCAFLGYALGYTTLGHPVNFKLLVVFTILTILLFYFFNKIGDYIG